MRKLSMITMLAASLCLPLTATAQSRYTQQNHYTQNQQSGGYDGNYDKRSQNYSSQHNARSSKQTVSKNHVYRGNMRPAEHNNNAAGAVALSTIAILAAIGLSKR